VISKASDWLETAGFHHMRVLPAIFVRIVPSYDVNGCVADSKTQVSMPSTTCACGAIRIFQNQSMRSRQLLVQQVQDSLPASLPVQKRFRGFFANLSTVKGKSKADSKGRSKADSVAVRKRETKGSTRPRHFCNQHKLESVYHRTSSLDSVS